MDPTLGSLFPEMTAGSDRTGSGANTPFASPFYDWTVSWMPRDVTGIFKWCEYLYKRNGIVRQAVKRIAQYPVTDLKFSRESTKVTDTYKDFLSNVFKYRANAIMIGTDLLVYGNSLTSLYLPFKRFLKCRSCKAETPITNKDLQWKFPNFTFQGTCPQCKARGDMDREDKKSFEPSGVNLIRWDPKQVTIHANKYSGVKEYYYTVPPEDAAAITEGRPHMIETIPWGMVLSVKDKRKFAFNPDQLYHIKLPSLAGEINHWGLPLFVNLFQLHFHTAIARRANEGIFLDYAMPQRVIYPDQPTQNTEPVDVVNMGRFREEMTKMLTQKRRDMLNVKISPIKIGYQALGGEAKSLNLFNEIKEINEEIMAAIGIPQDLFYGTMTIQAAPIALRLFENNWADYVAGLNEWIQWTCNKVGDYFDWEQIDVGFVPVRTIDDVERKGMMFNLAASGKVSDLEALETWGLDFKESQKKFKEQQNITTSIQQEAQEDAEMQQAAAPSDSPQAVTPGDLQSQAEQTATQMLQMPSDQRKSMLYNLSQQNETLHALVLKKMDQMRNRMGTQQAQQMAAQGQVMPPPGGPQGPQGPGIQGPQGPGM